MVLQFIRTLTKKEKVVIEGWCLIYISLSRYHNRFFLYPSSIKCTTCLCDEKTAFGFKSQLCHKKILILANENPAFRNCL